MSEFSSQPQPASFEECDDDSGVVLPNSKVVASRLEKVPSRQSSTTREKKTIPVYSRSSSSAKNPSAATPLPIIPIASSSRSKPVFHRSESRSKPVIKQEPPVLSRSNSTRRATVSGCGDPSCSDPNCMRIPAQERSRRDYAPVQPPPLQTQNLPSPRMAPPVGRPRQRTLSSSQARPLSWAPGGLPYTPDGFVPSTIVSAVDPRPPISSSPFWQMQSSHYAYPPAVSPGFATQTNVQPLLNPMPHASTMPYAPRPSSINYSARVGSTFAMSTSPAVESVPLPRARTPSFSARRISGSRPSMPGRFPEDEEADYSDSCSECEDDERRRQMPPPVSRPAMRSSRTTPLITQRPLYETGRRAPHSDTGIDLLAFDSVESTPRAVYERKYSSANSSRSRRQSLSTTASSGRTNPTTISSGSIVVEGPNGRRRYYPSDREFNDIVNRMGTQQMLDDARAYQDVVDGVSRVELTAANMREFSDQREYDVRSKRSGRSGKSGQSGLRPEGIEIVSGNSSVHVAGDARVEVRPPSDYGAAQIIIGTVVGRERRYEADGSRSSSSRIGRSRGGSERGHRQ